MTVANRTYDQLCPVAVSLDVLGDRWTILILRDLLWRGPHGYQELLAANPGISPTLLSDRLKSLTSQGLIEKVDIREGRRSTEYRLTEAGHSVKPVVDALYGFGADFMVETPLSPSKLTYFISLAEGNLGEATSGLDEHRVRLTVDGVSVDVAMGPGLLETVDDKRKPDASVAMTQDGLMALAANEPDVPVDQSGDPAAVAQMLAVLNRAAR